MQRQQQQQQQGRTQLAARAGCVKFRIKLKISSSTPDCFKVTEIDKTIRLKLYYDRLRNDKALGNIKSDNNKNNN